MKVIGNLDGQLNELINWKMQLLSSDPGATEARFFYNNSDKRVKVSTGTGYEQVAWLSDVYGLSNRKADIKAATTGDITLSGLQTIDDVALAEGDRVLVKDQTDKTQNGIYVVHTGAWTRPADNDEGEEITNSMIIVEEGTTNGGTIWKNTDTDPLVVGTDEIHYAQINITVPTKDETVKVSSTDNTEKYLRESFSNNDASGDALNNLNNIQFVLENHTSNETLRLALDLSSYTGNVNIDGGLTVTGDTVLHNLSFSSNSTVNRDNTTQTGTTTYDNNYNATYDGSTVNYTNGTTVNQDNTSVYNNDGTTNYSSTSVVNNNGGTVNNNNTTINNTDVTETYDGDSEVNYNNTEINYNSTYTSLGCTGDQALPVDDPIKPSATKADVKITYNGEDKTTTVTEGTGLVNVTIQDATFTVEWNTTSGNIEVRQTTGTGGTADVCQFSGGVIINNDGAIENNTNNIVNNNNTTENNTNVTEYYDENSTVVNEGDVYNSNLTVENISYATTKVAGEAISNRQPLRMGVVSLGEDTDKVYVANASDTDHSKFIGFAGADAAPGEEVVVLTGPRVDGMKDVYGVLTDGADYYLTDTGGIDTTPGTITKQVGTADGDDTLVGVNGLVPEDQLVTPAKIKANNTPTVGQVIAYVDDNTFTRTDGGAGSAMYPKKEGIQDNGTEVQLTAGPVGGADGLLVLKKDSGLVWFETTDYTYDAANNKVILNTALTSGEAVQVRYRTYQGTAPTDYQTQTINSDSATLTPGSFNLVTYNSGDVTLTLPDANTCEGQVIRIKKFTGNDTYDVIINPQSGQTIDGDTGVTFNIDKNQFAFIAVDGNRYIF